MIELALAIITILGTTVGVWLKLRAELETKSAAAEVELRKMQSDFTKRSGERDDHWRDILVASNVQWQTYAQKQLELLQVERDKHITQLVTNVEEARSDLQTAVHNAASAATNANNAAIKYMHEIVELKTQVKDLQLQLLALNNQITVLTNQNARLVNNADVSAEEKRVLSNEIDASKDNVVKEEILNNG